MEVTDLMEMVEEDRDISASLEDACRSLEIVLAGHRAAIEGQTAWLR